MRIFPRLIAALPFLALCASFAQPATQPVSTGPLRVVFFGNSHTYTHDVPSIVARFASAAGRAFETRDHTAPAATLDQLWGMRLTPQLLAEKWDYLVLQESTTRAIGAPQKMHESVRTFDAAGKKAGAKTILYVAFLQAGQQRSQASLNEAHLKVAPEIGAVVAPVGPARWIALEADPKLPLYEFDGLHASPTGAYLAGCTLYLAISGQQVCPELDFPGVTPLHAASARKAAERATAEWREQSGKK